MESARPFIESASARSRQLEDRLPLIANERRKSMAEVARAGVPSGKLETWKYTPINPFFAPPFGVDEAPTTEQSRGTEAFRSFAGATTVVLIGAQSLPAIASRSGVDIAALYAPLNADLDLARYPLAHLNTALLEEGLVIRVAPGVDAGVLDLRFAPGSGPARINRVRVELAAGSRLRLIEQRGEGCATNAVIDIQVGPDAALQHVRVLPPGDAAGWYLVSAHVDAGASYDLVGHAMGAKTRRCDIHVRLAGARANTNIDLGCAVHRHDRLDHQLVVEHVGVDTVSRQLVHGIAADRGELTFNGRIHIHPLAQRSDARLTNKNLLLDKNARVNTKPELEIYANDVKCSHGATVGQLDPAQLFYMRARGFDEAAARAVLTRAFLTGRMTPWLTEAGVPGLYAPVLAG